MWRLSQAIAEVGGTLHGTDCQFESVGINSRINCKGQLFVALRGENFDGHDFVAAAQQAGAVAALVERLLPIDLPQWIIPDTKIGLGQLAAAWRKQFTGKVLAITGSNGKTTVKEMLAAILSQIGSIRATQGNLNNDIGMPQTILQARNEDFLILELGANHPGEIQYLTNIARPDLALITNAGRAHLEGFGSLEGVARAKGEIVQGLNPNGIFITNNDSEYSSLWKELANKKLINTFALDHIGDISADSNKISIIWNEKEVRTEFSAKINQNLSSSEENQFTLRLAGRHNVRNALAAIAATHALRVPLDIIRTGLAHLNPVKGRLYPRFCKEIFILDDTYNANPDSLAAGLEVLAKSARTGRRWLVLGNLGELGTNTKTLHQEIGLLARASGIDFVYSIGELSNIASCAFGSGGENFMEQNELITALQANLSAGDRVLIKGSRVARMERVVDALCNN